MTYTRITPPLQASMNHNLSTGSRTQVILGRWWWWWWWWHSINLGLKRFWNVSSLLNTVSTANSAIINYIISKTPKKHYHYNYFIFYPPTSGISTQSEQQNV